MQLLMEQFHLSRKAASRQLTRYVLPEIMIITANMTHDDDRLMERRGGGGGNGLLVRNDQGLLDDCERGCHKQVDDSMEEKKGAKGIPLHQQQQQHQQQNHDCRHSPLKNGNDFTSTCSTTTTLQTIVIIDVISPIGQALLKHYYNTGRHTVAGCGCDGAVICTLKALYPMAILTAVDITNDTAIRDWTATNLVVKDTNGGGTELLVIDVVIVVAAASGVRWATNLPIWEASQKEFDTSIDYSVRGTANVIRHLVPRLIIRKDRGGSGGGTFVAVVSTGLDVAHAANTITSAYAIEGLIKSVANSIPDPLCAAILSPGLLPYVDMDEEEEQLRQHRTTKGDLGGGDRGRDVGQWANVAGPMILKMSRRNNGMSMSVPGF
jgi:NAD(P)-dependent dehydrogenase (short-subunit alcohol dehydrogenase family)